MFIEKAKAVFDSYNGVVAGCYKRFEEGNKKKNVYKDEEDWMAQIEKALKEETSKWENEALEELEGLTPAGFFKSLEELDQVIEVFKLGAKQVDGDLPKAFLDVLKGFGDKAEDALISLACDRTLIDADGDDFLIPLMAIKVLGMWKVEKAAGPLTDMLAGGAIDKEVINEGIRDALINIGRPSIMPILQSLENMDNIEDAGEFLMTALADIGKDNKDDRIYRCLKNAFLRMKNKVIGAICLSIYGDGRAIPALRGYVEKNLGNIDMETFYEIKYAVSRLGGNMDDILYYRY